MSFDTGGIWQSEFDECDCCRLNTAGNHETGCPCAVHITGYGYGLIVEREDEE